MMEAQSRNPLIYLGRFAEVSDGFLCNLVSINRNYTIGESRNSQPFFAYFFPVQKAGGTLLVSSSGNAVEMPVEKLFSKSVKWRRDIPSRLPVRTQKALVEKVILGGIMRHRGEITGIGLTHEGLRIFAEMDAVVPKRSCEQSRFFTRYPVSAVG